MKSSYKKALGIGLVVLIGAYLLFLFVIFPNKKQNDSFVGSPSGYYYVQATVENARRGDALPGFALPGDVVVHLYDLEKEYIGSLPTGAGNHMKWALGWDLAEDIIVLQSSDVGDRAWRVFEGHLTPIDPVPEHLRERAQELYDEKYFYD